MKKPYGANWFGILMLWASAALPGVGCKKTDESEKAIAGTAAPRASADRLADGKRIEKVVADWARRWDDLSPLPNCGKLVENGNVELCTNAQTALTTLKRVLAEKQPHSASLRIVAELALAAEKTNDELNAIVRARHSDESAPPGGTITRRAGRPGVHGDDAIQDNASAEAYGRASRLALRHLSVYLQYGPLPVRHAAFAEYERLSKERPAWPGLLRSLREASLMERDAALSGKLKALIAKHREAEPQGTTQPAARPRTNVAREVADVKR